jgi:peptide/nickel transport system ATP-binding protein
MSAVREAVVGLRGKRVEEGTGAQAEGAPRHAYTQRLLASLPVPDPDPGEHARRRSNESDLHAAE